MMIVSDSSPLIALSTIGRFPALRSLFGVILVPEAVYDEVVVKGSGRPGHDEVSAGVAEGWIRRESTANALLLEHLLGRLHRGEAEAIVLAKERDADVLLVDDERARVEARYLELRILGTVGILLECAKRGITGDLAGDLARLQESGFRIRAAVLAQVLREAGVDPG